jgi:hypothetical protein
VPWCVINACDVEGEECTAQGCVDLCAGVTCGAGEVCNRGECGPDMDCTFTGCPAGERCHPNGCEPDPCVGVNCGEGSFCRDGECVFSCAEVSCPTAHACFDGLCEPTGCLPLGCPYEGEVCIDRICQADPCDLVTCESAEICSLGECLPNPCLGVECPQYQRCEVTLGTAQCVADWPILEASDLPPDMMVMVEEEDMGTTPEDMGNSSILADILPPDVEMMVPENKDEGCNAQGRQNSSVILFMFLFFLLTRICKETV